MNIFQTYGIVTDPSQQRALSAEEIGQMMLNQMSGMAQAQESLYRRAMAVNAWHGLLQDADDQPAPRPLDERFADFKKRLEAMLERYPSGAPPL